MRWMREWHASHYETDRMRELHAIFPIIIHPRKNLTWNPKMVDYKRNLLFYKGRFVFNMFRLHMKHPKSKSAHFLNGLAERTILQHNQQISGNYSLVTKKLRFDHLKVGSLGSSHTSSRWFGVWNPIPYTEHYFSRHL